MPAQPDGPREDEDDNPFLALAWLDFIVYAFGNAELVAAFNQRTGASLGQPPGTALDALIDLATDKLDRETEAFVLWVTEEFWGVAWAPKKVRAAIARQHAASG